MAYVLRENVPSRRGLEKLQLVPQGRIRWFHVGPYGLELRSRNHWPAVGVHVRRRRLHE